MPNDQGNQVRIIWERFGGLDPIDYYVVNRWDAWEVGDTTWTTVATVPAFDAPRYAMVVPTIYNESTTFEVVAVTVVGEEMVSGPGEGTSVDNLVPTAPTSPQAIAEAGVVTLSWEAPADAVRDTDINVYHIFRSTTPDFTPRPYSPYATTIELSFEDAVANPGDYYYRIAAEDFNGNLGEYSIQVDAHITGIEDTDLPTEYALSQNYPNPFNPTTTIKFQLKEAGHVNLVIYDHIGREVLSLVDRPMSAGYHSINVGADRLASGIYFYRIRANEFTATRKMLLLK